MGLIGFRSSSQMMTPPGLDAAREREYVIHYLPSIKIFHSPGRYFVGIFYLIEKEITTRSAILIGSIFIPLPAGAILVHNRQKLLHRDGRYVATC